MLQVIDGREVFVVELTGFPRENLPITWKTEKERPYAIALDSAIRARIVKTAGKFGVYVTEHPKTKNLTYHCYSIKD